MNSETVEISKNTLVELVRSHLIFNALTYGGVDNWGGYGENFNEEKAEILNYLPEIREEFCKEGYCEDLEDMPSFREIAQKLVDHDIKNFDFWKNLCYNYYTIKIKETLTANKNNKTQILNIKNLKYLMINKPRESNISPWR